MKIIIVWLACGMFIFGALDADNQIPEGEEPEAFAVTLALWPILAGAMLHDGLDTTILKKQDRLPMCDGSYPPCECFPFPCGRSE